MENNEEFCKRYFTVRFSDCDYNSRVKLSSLFRFMEESAVADAEENGYGLRQLIRSGYTLVLSRQKLRLTHQPLEGERLSVETWTKSIEGKVALKDFSFKDSQGNALAQATTSWLLISLKTGKAVDFSECPFPIFVSPNREALTEKLDLLLPESSGREVYTRVARYSDLDLNMHVNHCRYVEWCMDVFDLEELKSRQLRSIQMNYLSQIPFGEETKLIRFDNSRNHALICGVSATNLDIVRFQARIGFSQ